VKFIASLSISATIFAGLSKLELHSVGRSDT
jgi:hypothetical protein